jgi:hypothetical protein
MQNEIVALIITKQELYDLDGELIGEHEMSRTEIDVTPRIGSTWTYKRGDKKPTFTVCNIVDLVINVTHTPAVVYTGASGTAYAMRVAEFIKKYQKLEG